MLPSNKLRLHFPFVRNSKNDYSSDDGHAVNGSRNDDDTSSESSSSDYSKIEITTTKKLIFNNMSLILSFLFFWICISQVNATNKIHSLDCYLVTILYHHRFACTFY